MANLRIIREGLEAGDDLAVLLRTHAPLEDGWLRKVVDEKLRMVHAGLREAVELERKAFKNRRVQDEEHP